MFEVVDDYDYDYGYGDILVKILSLKEESKGKGFYDLFIKLFFFKGIYEKEQFLKDKLIILVMIFDCFFGLGIGFYNYDNIFFEFDLEIIFIIVVYWIKFLEWFFIFFEFIIFFFIGKLKFIFIIQVKFEFEIFQVREKCEFCLVKVKVEVQCVWQGYKIYVWIYDEFCFVLKVYYDFFCGWVVMFVDFFDMFWIMGFKLEFEDVLKVVVEIDFIIIFY